jgi:hypothetical protein
LKNYSKVESPNWAGEQTGKKPQNQYAPYSEPLTDETVLSFGEHKGKRLIDVPASWLIWYYEAPDDFIKNKWLFEYIRDNYEALQKEK